MLKNNVESNKSIKPLKILFIRGLGTDRVETTSKITNAFLEFLKCNLSYAMQPHEIDIAQLDGSGNKKKWLKTLDTINLENYDVIISHSTGVHAILYCATYRKIKKLLLLAATPYHYNDRTEISTGWFDEEFDYEKIKSNVDKIMICNSKDDPYIRKEDALALGSRLNAITYIFDKQRHLSSWLYGNILDNYNRCSVNTILKDLVEELVYKS